MDTERNKPVLTVGDIQRILQIGRNSAYTLLHSAVFPVIVIGRSFRIPSEPFFAWFDRSSEVENKNEFPS